MEYKIFKTVQELLEIEADYNDLLERIEDRQVFYEFAWLKNYILYYPDKAAKDGSLRIVAGYQNKKLLILCPFCLCKKTLRFICEEATDYNTILVDKTLNAHSALKELVAYMSENIAFRSIRLKEFRQSDVLRNFYVIMNLENYKAFLQISSLSPYCVVPSDGGKFVKSELKKISKRTKKLLAEHTVNFEFTTTMTENDLAFVANIKNAAFGENIFSQNETWQFFLYMNRDLPTGFAIYKCFVDGELASLFFCFQDSEKIYSYCPIYSRKFSAYGIGQIVRQHIMETMPASGKIIFDFLRGNEPHKFHFCDRIESNFTLTVIPLTRLTKVRLFCYRAGQFVLRKIFLP